MQAHMQADVRVSQNRTMKRRSFLEVGGLGLLANSTALLQAKAPAIAFPKNARERLAVASYPFREFIQYPGAKPRQDGKGRMPLTDFPSMVVQRFNVHNTEPLSEHFVSREPQYLKELRDAHEKAGARIVNIPFSPAGSFCDPDDAKRQAAVDDARQWVDAAVMLGSPSVRAHIEGIHGTEPDVERSVASLKALAAYGQQKQVVVNLENDDPKSEKAEFITKIIERVASPWLHALPDFCNSMLVGDSEYNDRSLRAMFRHAYNISHVKDSEVDAGKVYRVDVAHIFQIAKSSGYRGFFSMEWEGEADPYTGTQQLIEQSLGSLEG